MIATTTKERPILFSAPMVRAILDGRKTQTRRVVKARHATHPDYPTFDVRGGTVYALEYDSDGLKAEWPMPCPYGQPGERLWVRETWAPVSTFDPSPDTGAFYRADYLDDPHGPDGEKSPEGRYRTWKPSIHMPRWASRIDLEITGVRFERLQDINEADAFHEGAERPECGPFELHGVPVHPMTGSYQEGFKKLWQSINGPDSWAANPWVWVIEFQRIGGA